MDLTPLAMVYLDRNQRPFHSGPKQQMDHLVETTNEIVAELVGRLQMELREEFVERCVLVIRMVASVHED